MLRAAFLPINLAAFPGRLRVQNVDPPVLTCAVLGGSGSLSVLAWCLDVRNACPVATLPHRGCHDVMGRLLPACASHPRPTQPHLSHTQVQQLPATGRV
jgi:hypothetical protein